MRSCTACRPTATGSDSCSTVVRPDLWHSRSMQVDDAFTFASQPALNLHHLLWAEAWAVESAETGRPSRAQPVTGNLALQETPGFQAGIDYYRAHLIERHLLFDDTMHELSQRLVGRGGAAPAGWEEVFTPVLGDYLDADWPVHDQQNQAWAASSRAQLEELLPAALDRLQHLFRQALPDPPVLISTVYVGDRLPGFTSLHPTHITCSSSHPEIQGIAAGEIILHEASHALIPDLRRAIEVRIDASQQPLDSCGTWSCSSSPARWWPVTTPNAVWPTRRTWRRPVCSIVPGPSSANPSPTPGPATSTAVGTGTRPAIAWRTTSISTGRKAGVGIRRYGEGMDAVALVGLLDSRGWLLLQERDEHASVDPDKWSLVGGGVEPGESPPAAARRELAEETGIQCDDLTALGSFDLPCTFHGQDHVELFSARMSLTDAAVECNEGRQMIFVDPGTIAGLDLTDMTRALFPTVLSSHGA